MEVRTPFSLTDPALVDALDDGVVVTDAARRVTEVSDRFCALVGYAREELVGACPPYPWWPRGGQPPPARSPPARGGGSWGGPRRTRGGPAASSPPRSICTARSPTCWCSGRT